VEYISIDISPYHSHYNIMRKPYFQWDESKSSENERKHGVSFSLAQLAFLDPERIILEDLSHSEEETRYYLHRVNRRGRTDSAIHIQKQAGKDFRSWILEKG
jgi:uncharacterized DUF497 family protein